MASTLQELEQYAIGVLTPDTDSREFWQAAHEGRFVLQSCVRCGRRQYPPLPRCRFCRADELKWTPAPATGRLHSWIVVNHALLPRQRALTPYSVGLVELEPGVRVVALLDVPIDLLQGELTLDIRAEPAATAAVIVASVPADESQDAMSSGVGSDAQVRAMTSTDPMLGL